MSLAQTYVLVCHTQNFSVTPTTLVYYNAFKLITHTDTNKHTHNFSLPLTGLENLRAGL